MWIVAIKECPQGQLPGTVFEAPDAAANVLIAAAAAERVLDPPVASGESVLLRVERADGPKRRGRYARRDLRPSA